MWNTLTTWIDAWFNTTNTTISIKLHSFSITNLNNTNHINISVNKVIKFNIDNKYTNLTTSNKNKLVNYTISNNSNLNKINVN